MKSKDFNKIKPYTYFLERKSDGLKYYGVRYANISSNTTPEKDFAKNYFSSGTLKEEFKKNPNNFKWRLCWTFNTINEAKEYEAKINKRIYKRNDWANNNAYPHINLVGKQNGMYGVHRFGKDNPMYGKKHSEETKQKIREKSIGRFTKKWFIDKYGKINGLKIFDEHYKKISKATKGLKRSEETKKKISENNVCYWKGKTMPLEIREKMSKKRKGVLKSKETKQKMREAWKLRKEGRKL
jgi:hypothetical protein